MMNTQPVIRTRRLTRYFGSKAAVLDLDLEVPRGGVFAFLGRNGAGKTTVIRMLLGLLRPTRGSGEVLGHDIQNLAPDVRARIGYLTEEHRLYDWMTVAQSGRFQARFFATWRDKVWRGVLDHFALKPDAFVRDLSRGERAGLCLALTLAPDPELLVLDDPGLGLDPVARRALVESMIFLTRKSDRTIFFSSHHLGDVERVADFVAVLDHSVLRACCPLEVFRDRVRQYRLRFAGPPPAVASLPGFLQAVRATPDELRITLVEGTGAAQEALRALGAVEIEPTPLSLEDAVIAYLGERREKSFILTDTEETL
jgi:ABC-2 type transport system ATP-binding protein